MWVVLELSFLTVWREVGRKGGPQICGTYKGTKQETLKLYWERESKKERNRKEGPTGKKRGEELLRHNKLSPHQRGRKIEGGG